MSSVADMCAAGGDFFGLADDGFYAVPQNISTIVDVCSAFRLTMLEVTDTTYLPAS